MVAARQDAVVFGVVYVPTSADLLLCDAQPHSRAALCGSGWGGGAHIEGGGVMVQESTGSCAISADRSCV